MDSATRKAVRRRAGSRCKYCGLAESTVEIPFHVEHVVAKQHGGGDALNNLALACDRCNLFKGPNLTSIDPESGAIEPLFHPRRDEWNEHFSLHDSRIVGLTPKGRATVSLLQMNAPARVQLRRSIGQK
jgi:hypothetical protein